MLFRFYNPNAFLLLLFRTHPRYQGHPEIVTLVSGQNHHSQGLQQLSTNGPSGFLEWTWDDLTYYNDAARRSGTPVKTDRHLHRQSNNLYQTSVVFNQIITSAMLILELISSAGDKNDREISKKSRRKQAVTELISRRA